MTLCEEGNSNAVELIATLPEIVATIMQFLSVPTLTKCTSVNSIWEKEATTHLFSRLTMLMYPKHLEDYLCLMAVRSRCHKRLHIARSTLSPTIDLLPLLESFALLFSRSIEQLAVPWNLEGNKSRKLFEVLGKFRNLKCLELIAFLPEEIKYPDIKDTTWFPKNIALSNIIHLYISGETHKTELNSIIAQAVPELSRVFCNVTRLGMFYIPRLMWMSHLHYFSNVTSLSLRKSERYLNNDIIPELPLPLQIHITRLELEIHSYDYKYRCTTVSTLFTMFSETVEYLTIISYESTNIKYVPPEIHLFPIMPKLKGLKIMLPPRTTDDDDDYKCSARPNLFFRFITENKYAGVSIDYSQQFPMLRSLTIQHHKTLKSVYDGRSMVEDDFESFIPFMYATFLPPNIPPCLTLRQIKVPLPTGAAFKLRPKSVCECETSSCECWDVMASHTYYDRIVTTFPSLDYKVFESSRQRMEAEMTRLWLKQAREMPFLQNLKLNAN